MGNECSLRIWNRSKMEGAETRLTERLQGLRLNQFNEVYERRGLSSWSRLRIATPHTCMSRWLETMRAYHVFFGCYRNACAVGASGFCIQQRMVRACSPHRCLMLRHAQLLDCPEHIGRGTLRQRSNVGP